MNITVIIAVNNNASYYVDGRSFKHFMELSSFITNTIKSDDIVLISDKMKYIHDLEFDNKQLVNVSNIDSIINKYKNCKNIYIFADINILYNLYNREIIDDLIIGIVKNIKGDNVIDIENILTNMAYTEFDFCEKYSIRKYKYYK